MDTLAEISNEMLWDVLLVQELFMAGPEFLKRVHGHLIYACPNGSRKMSAIIVRSDLIISIKRIYGIQGNACMDIDISPARYTLISSHLDPS